MVDLAHGFELVDLVKYALFQERLTNIGRMLLKNVLVLSTIFIVHSL